VERPGVEVLEGRRLPAPILFTGTLTVNTAKDEMDGGTVSFMKGKTFYDPGPDNKLSLREAIAVADAVGVKAGRVTIDFGPAVKTIAMKGGFKSITHPVLIDGGAGVELDGSAAGAGVSGLTIEAGGSKSTIRGLVINGFERNTKTGKGGNGIVVVKASGVHIEDNFIGTNKMGTAIKGNGGSGVLISDGSGNFVGGKAAGAGNVISGNGVGTKGTAGVTIEGKGATGDLVQGNFIGTNKGGTKDLGNRNGVLIENMASGNTVGGMAAGTDNIISGNDNLGVVIDSGATSNKIQGNFIGTDVTGSKRLGNGFAGVLIDGASGNTVGGDTKTPGTISGNIIAGNTGSQVIIRFTSSNAVLGNFIGIGKNGAALGSISNGVAIIDASKNTVGGTSALARNIISGNGINGLKIFGSGSSKNLVQGNYIGTSPDGTSAVGNGTNGVLIEGASDNTIGGTSAKIGDPPGNVIAGNEDDGILIHGTDLSGPANGNRVQGNLVGLNSKGQKLGNFYGVFSGMMADDTRIGVEVINGKLSGTGNIIAGNTFSGVVLLGKKNEVMGNFIGTDGQGGKLGNGFQGIHIQGAENMIGGTMDGQGNVICSNGPEDTGGTGILLNGFATKNRILGNLIGIDKQGRKLGNAGNGIVLAQATHNTVGGMADGSRNVISDNGENGVVLRDQLTRNNQVLNNFIGTDVNGTMAVGNKGIGVWIEGARNNTIGALGGKNIANVISGNTAQGVRIGGGATRNEVLHNLIGLDKNGTNPLGNGTVVGKEKASGVWLDGVANNTIGGNTISASGRFGVRLDDTATGNQIIHNRIGTDSKGSNKNAALLNMEASAVLLERPTTTNAVRDNTIAIATTTKKADAILDNGTKNVTMPNTIEGGKPGPAAPVGVPSAAGPEAFVGAPVSGIGLSIAREPLLQSTATVIGPGNERTLVVGMFGTRAPVATIGQSSAGLRVVVFAQAEPDDVLTRFTAGLD
jgi:titin